MRYRTRFSRNAASRADSALLKATGGMVKEARGAPVRLSMAGCERIEGWLWGLAPFETGHNATNLQDTAIYLHSGPSSDNATVPSVR